MNPNILAGQHVPRWFWPLLLGLNLLLHAPFFNQPPNSLHVWRQANTMAVARNLHEEELNLLRPRVDRRNDSDGVTGMQFPSYEGLVAVGYRVFGFHEAIPRLTSWLLFAAGLVAFYGLVRRITGAAWPAAVATWGLGWSPELFYHSINALPDILALGASVGGLYFFLRWYQGGRRRPDFALALLLTTLAGLTKLQYLVIGFPIAVLVLRDAWQRRLRWPDLLPLALFAAVAVGLTLAWYRYAVVLIERSGLADFGLELRPAESLAVGLKTLQRNLVSDLPELLLNFANFGLLLLGLVALGRRRLYRHPWFGPVLAWALALAAYHLIELRQMTVHQYYMLPYLPVLLLVVAAGARALARQPRWHWLLALLLAAQPVLAFVRIVPARWARGANNLAPELFDAGSRARLRAAVPDSALCVVGPDVSGCIDFYFLHKKGFGFDAGPDLFRPTPTDSTYLRSCIRRGARYLYTNDSLLVADPRLRPYVAGRVRKVGAFEVLALRPESGEVAAVPAGLLTR